MNSHRLRRLLAMLALCLAWLPGACGDSTGGPEFVILSGSENQELEPIVREFGRQQGVRVRIDYLGSVDISNALHLGTGIAADAVWPANRLWIALGDTQKVVRHDASIMRSPVILGLRRSFARKLGWAGRPDLGVRDILAEAKAGRLRYAMTSATQSNSGASFYLAALHAMAGSPPTPLQADHLADPAVRARIKDLLATINRSSGSSGWLKTLYLDQADRLDGMINYESIIWETNRALAEAGEEPLCAIYPADAVAIADHPLGLIARGDADKERFFLDLQKYLLSPEVQKRIMAIGRRGGAIGLEADAKVLTADECFDTTRVISPVPLPAETVIEQALNLYQTVLRKPSATVYVLDVSGSMKGERLADLKKAMDLLLDPAQAAPLLLQAGPDDLHIVIPFNEGLVTTWTATGNDPVVLNGLRARIDGLSAGGGTDIYGPTAAALRKLADLGPRLSGYFPAVILLTDGESNRGRGLIEVKEALDQLALKQPIPVFAIAFGEADLKQLGGLSAATSGKVFDSRKGLAKAFREAKGYN